MFEAQIAKGVEYLDEDLGQSWIENIDPEILDLQGCTNCVIGQLYGDFDDTPDTFDAAPLGFDLPTAENGLMQYKHYDVLTQEWKEKITQLQAERKV